MSTRPDQKMVSRTKTRALLATAATMVKLLSALVVLAVAVHIMTSPSFSSTWLR